MTDIALVGSTGDLGSRILRELTAQQAKVRCLVREGTSSEKIQKLNQAGAQVRPVNFSNETDLARSLEGCGVTVSAVSGLHEVIVGLQSKVLRASVLAGVPRFIPSDFAIDYRPIPQGENRNLNLREEFRKVLDAESKIQATSILNGAFTDMLTGIAPFVLYPIRRILCWGNPEQLMDWTTIDDTARYTAYAAMDSTTPRYLKIAGDELSANKLAQIMTEITGKNHKVFRPGGTGMLSWMIKMTKVMAPGPGEVYPPWQGMQYMHSMYVGRSKHDRLDNSRYPVKFTTAKELLTSFLAGKISKYIPKG